ncbi:MAG TPA: cytochrome P450 [Solirubrobacteraceae bacterium]|nr:cytochrome P450 [Solirubrobacteraceae bacterium]
MRSRAAFPGPRAPRAVQLLRFLRDEEAYTNALHRRYGDAFRVQFERRPWHMFADPQAVREIFTAPAHVVHAGDANEILRPTLGAHSVLVIDGEEHLRQRRMLLPRFHGDRLHAWRGAMERVARERVRRMPPGRAFSLRPHMTAIALEVILEVVLGLRGGEEHARIGAAVDRLLNWLAVPRNLVAPVILGPDHPLARRAQRPVLAPVDAALYRLIGERRGAPDLAEREDILSMLLLATDEHGAGMDDAEVRDEVVTLIVAGHETTATALSWAFERLTRDPARLARLEDEAQAGQSTEYAEAVFREALRLRPVLNNVVRTLQEPYEICGVEYPAGDVLAPSIYLVHRRPDVYPDPRAFVPERWVERSPGTYTWIPFGGGTRRCIGAQFAQMEMEIVLHAIAREVRLEPVGAPERPVPRFITSSPARGCEVRIAERRTTPARPREAALRAAA